MHHRIRPALKRTLSRISALLAPATGRPPEPEPTAGLATPRTASGRRLLVCAAAPPHLSAALRARPRALPLDDGPIFDAPGPLVRPYLLAYEQQERRSALALALEGVDVGPEVIHGHPVGSPVLGATA